jgi:hypothetical protein
MFGDYISIVGSNAVKILLIKLYNFTANIYLTCKIKLKTLKPVKSTSKLDQICKLGPILRVWKKYKIVQYDNIYLSIFIVSNLYLAKLVQFYNQILDFDYNYYNFLNYISYL